MLSMHRPLPSMLIVTPCRFRVPVKSSLVNWLPCRADLLPLLGQSSPATLSRQLARLRHLGVIKRVLGTYRYYLTRAGRAAIAAGRRLTEHIIIPALSSQIFSQNANTQVVSD